MEIIIMIVIGLIVGVLVKLFMLGRIWVGSSSLSFWALLDRSLLVLLVVLLVGIVFLGVVLVSSFLSLVRCCFLRSIVWSWDAAASLDANGRGVGVRRWSQP